MAADAGQGGVTLCAAVTIDAPAAEVTILDNGKAVDEDGFLGGAIASGTWILTQVVHFGAAYAGPTRARWIVDAAARTLEAAWLDGETATSVRYALANASPRDPHGLPVVRGLRSEQLELPRHGRGHDAQREPARLERRAALQQAGRVSGPRRRAVARGAFRPRGPRRTPCRARDDWVPRARRRGHGRARMERAVVADRRLHERAVLGRRDVERRVAPDRRRGCRRRRRSRRGPSACRRREISAPPFVQATNSHPRFSSSASPRGPSVAAARGPAADDLARPHVERERLVLVLEVRVEDAAPSSTAKPSGSPSSPTVADGVGRLAADADDLMARAPGVVTQSSRVRATYCKPVGHRASRRRGRVAPASARRTPTPARRRGCRSRRRRRRPSRSSDPRAAAGPTRRAPSGSRR